MPLDVGIARGFFKKRGLDVEAIAFAGDAKMQQAAAAGSIESVAAAVWAAVEPRLV
mgnify:CR=1 FL=1